jgi:exosome complex RNA-binding protein Csl4
MKSTKKKTKNVDMVSFEGHTKNEPKIERLGLEAYFTVRRHSRVLYLPLDPTAVRLHDIQKGDIVKARLIQVRKSPRPDDPF